MKQLKDGKTRFDVVRGPSKAHFMIAAGNMLVSGLRNQSNTLLFTLEDDRKIFLLLTSLTLKEDSGNVFDFEGRVTRMNFTPTGPTKVVGDYSFNVSRDSGEPCGSIDLPDDIKPLVPNASGENGSPLHREERARSQGFQF